MEIGEIDEIGKLRRLTTVLSSQIGSVGPFSFLLLYFMMCLSALV
jgi:hypothetical protein